MAPTTKTAKKISPKPNKKMSLSGFIRSMPNAKAAEVVAAAAKKGIKLSEKYVYVVRSGDRKRTGKAAVGRGRRAKQTGNNVERDFRSLVLRIGVDRAQALLTEIMD
jgi:hypothetical protein